MMVTLILLQVEAREHVTDSCGFMDGYDDVYHALIPYAMYTTSGRMLGYGVVHHCIKCFILIII